MNLQNRSTITEKLDLRETLVQKPYQQIDDIQNLDYRQQIEFKWVDLNVKVRNGNDVQRYILQNSSGYVKPGEVLTIMGPSGAGKSTLLQMLSKFYFDKTKVEQTGKIYMNNQEYTKQEFLGNCVFIKQDDTLMESMTVRESIQFAAYLRLNCCGQEKQYRINQIIKQLKLERCQHTKVGGYFIKGVSGGEKKRTSIAVELVSNPSSLILDEPTSGLDSFTAYLIVNLLIKLAKDEGKTIIFTIHQPSSEIFMLLDRLLLMKNGQTVYQGPAKQIISYLQKLNQEVPDYCNPADFFMQMLISKQNNILTNQNYLESDCYKIVQEEIQYLDQNDSKLLTFAANSFCFEVQQIFIRSFIDLIRNPLQLAAKGIQLVFIVLFFGVLWHNVGQKQPQQPANINNTIQYFQQNLTGAMYFFMLGVFMMVAIPITVLFPIEMQVFLREINSKTYRVFSYFVGKLMTELPYVILFPFIYNSALYWIFGLREGGMYIDSITLIAFSLCANGIAIANGCMYNSPKIALEMTPMIIIPFALVAGALCNLNSLPVYYSWFQYISPFKYAFEAIMRNQFLSPYFQIIADNNSVYDIDIFQLFGFNIGLWNSIIAIFIIAILSHIMAYFFLLMQSKKSLA